ncbi:hypothetical protein CORC01_12582 [Colletotrichum orchidophilum]|uniref:Uncharacterized protein n=1 Tax=Colletotrichum orchidophilum TaxID=1209926 RepID=A0A1G4ASI0_9PEZI|nr:uncharacterized protein CORC01_12582 [Colletotrichum orchidophilum]OHE92127.1 hypothetical protein CORC01_12582 [Colletotrichum orchidophilum]
MHLPSFLIAAILLRLGAMADAAAVPGPAAAIAPDAVVVKPPPYTPPRPDMKWGVRKQFSTSPNTQTHRIN